jgi:hypothetical protein
MLQPAAGAVLGERREKADVAWMRVRYSQTTTGTNLIMDFSEMDVNV